MNWYFEVLRKYATFTGRARRKEYWMFTLIHLIICFAITIPAVILASNGDEELGGIFIILLMLYILATFIPSLAVTVRRLHDTGRSGWWILLNFIPVVNTIGSIVMIIFMCMDSQPGNDQDSTTGNNKYGVNPKLNKKPETIEKF